MSFLSDTSVHGLPSMIDDQELAIRAGDIVRCQATLGSNYLQLGKCYCVEKTYRDSQGELMIYLRGFHFAFCQARIRANRFRFEFVEESIWRIAPSSSESTTLAIPAESATSGMTPEV